MKNIALLLVISNTPDYARSNVTYGLKFLEKTGNWRVRPLRAGWTIAINNVLPHHGHFHVADPHDNRRLPENTIACCANQNQKDRSQYSDWQPNGKGPQ
jgi:hypothetical protein